MGRDIKVEFGRINQDNIEQLRKVNLACFPVQYQEKYYKDVSNSKDDGLCKFAYFNGFVVGAACARIEPIHHNTNPTKTSQEQTSDLATNEKRIYIMTLGVLAAYRGRTIGTQLIQSILDYYEEEMKKADTADHPMKDVTEISLHVQISNDDAIQFYTEKFGFQKGEMVENYYRRIDPPHCYKLYKKLP